MRGRRTEALTTRMGWGGRGVCKLVDSRLISGVFLR